MFIRPAVIDDIPSICQLQQQLFEAGSIYGFVPETVEQVEKSIGAYFFVAEAAGKVIGFVSGAIHLSDGLAVIPKGEDYLEIENLYVAPQFRKQGIGGKLIDELLRQAKQNGVAYARLYSATKDLRGILKFYERHNFQSWYVEMF